jgi:hypothetical protein
MNEAERYYGKYRGTVLNNVDPMQIGRLLVQVPDVTGLTPSSWAMPCFPITGKQMGAYMIPQIGTGVWVEFEQGDPDHPIWSGCWYGSAAEVPALAWRAICQPEHRVADGAAKYHRHQRSAGATGGIMLKS